MTTEEDEKMMSQFTRSAMSGHERIVALRAKIAARKAERFEMLKESEASPAECLRQERSPSFRDTMTEMLRNKLMEKNLRRFMA